MPSEQYYCGCCGVNKVEPPAFCAECEPHLDPDKRLAPWFRTYSNLHPDEDCPVAVAHAKAMDRNAKHCRAHT